MFGSICCPDYRPCPGCCYLSTLLDPVEMKTWNVSHRTSAIIIIDYNFWNPPSPGTVTVEVRHESLTILVIITGLSQRNGLAQAPLVSEAPLSILSLAEPAPLDCLISPEPVNSPQRQEE